jgi:hypothetical protein
MEQEFNWNFRSCNAKGKDRLDHFWHEDPSSLRVGQRFNYDDGYVVECYTITEIGVDGISAKLNRFFTLLLKIRSVTE